MAAFIMIDRLSMTDPDTFSGYPDPARAAVNRFGGRFVLPTETQIEALEGKWRVPWRIWVRCRGTSWKHAWSCWSQTLK